MQSKKKEQKQKRRRRERQKKDREEMGEKRKGGVPVRNPSLHGISLMNGYLLFRPRTIPPRWEGRGIRNSPTPLQWFALVGPPSDAYIYLINTPPPPFSKAERETKESERKQVKESKRNQVLQSCFRLSAVMLVYRPEWSPDFAILTDCFYLICDYAIHL